MNAYENVWEQFLMPVCEKNDHYTNSRLNDSM